MIFYYWIWYTSYWNYWLTKYKSLIRKEINGYANGYSQRIQQYMQFSNEAMKQWYNETNNRKDIWREY